MRVDAHQHYWKFHPVRDAWINDEMSLLRRDFLPDHIAPELAAAGVDAVVAVQADQSDAETRFLLDLATRHSFIRGVVGWIDLCAPDLADRLEQLRTGDRLKGFRHIAQAEADDFLAWPEVVAGIIALGEQGYSYDILIYPRQLRAAARLVEQCPGVRFVLDHCAKPPIATGEIAAWRTDLGRLARHPNVWCKVSGLVTEAAWGTWTDADLAPYLDAAAELFGPARLMFGSDWPVCLVAARYDSVVGAVERWADRLTATERADIFGVSAVRAYQLGDADGS